MIAVCIPSRGLMHSRTMHDVLRNINGYEVSFIFAHSMPVPEAFNYLAEQALETDATRIWFVDDDMLLPDGILDEMLKVKSDLVIADYPVDADKPTVRNINGTVIGGFGCVLMTPKVLEAMEKPYFRADTRYNLPELNPSEVLRPDKEHGLHDVDFFIRAKKAGFEPHVIKSTAGQYNIVKMGEKTGNNTAYEIEEWRFK